MAEPLSNRPNAPLQVLIADDDDLLAAVLAQGIERLGCRVEVVADGQAALEALSARPFHLLLTDWMMPGLDGVDLTRAIRARPEFGGLHIILMTARREKATIARALEAGVDDLLYKPVEPQELDLCIGSARRVVELHRRLNRRNRHVAFAQARVREAYRRIREDLRAAGDLQRRLLPPEKTSGALRFAWAFEPSIEVGGDGLGAIPLGEDRLLFFHFDVAGHGVAAALRSFTVHHRLIQLAPQTPQELVAATEVLNTEIFGQEDDGYLTMALGLADARAGRLWLIRAGHPTPLLLARDEPARFLEGGSFPIGLFASAEPELTELEFPTGAKLVLFSDGLLDPEQGGCLELSELAQICTLHQSGGAGHMAQALQREGLARISGLPEDDISILVIESAAEDLEPILKLTIQASLEAVRAASRTLEARLAERGVEQGMVADLNLAFVEAANNVVVHGGAEAPMDLNVAVESAALRLELIDSGAAIPEAVLLADAPEDPLAESGRGLSLIRACVDELTYASEHGRNRLVLVRRLAREPA